MAAEDQSRLPDSEMHAEAMRKAAELVGMAMTYFRQTAAEALAELEYQRLEYLAGRVPAPPHLREAPPVGHPRGEGCVLPSNVDVWTIVDCECGARWRLYPDTRGWGRIDG